MRGAINILAFLLFFGVSTKAQFPFHLHYNVNDGLPSSEIYDITQDTLGNIWLGTSYGVSRFNGYSFRNFTTNDGLGGNSTILIFNSSDRIWFLSYDKKLSYSKDGEITETTELNQTIEADIHPNHQYSISIGKDNSVFFISKDNKLIKIGKDKRRYTIDSLTKEMDFFHPIFKYHNGVSLLSSTQRSQSGEDSFTNAFQENIHITPYSQSGYFLHHQAQVTYKNKAFDADDNPEDFLKYHHPKNITIENTRNFWFRKTIDGIVRFTKEQKRIVKRHYLKNKRVTRVLKDRESNYWFCTEGDGLYMVPSLQFNVYNKNRLLPSENVISLEIYDSFLFCGTNNNQLFRMKVEKGSVKEFSQILQNDDKKFLRDIFIDKENSLWLIVSEFMHYDFEGKHIPPDYIILNKPYSASPALDGGVLIATKYGYLKYKNNHLIYDSRQDGFDAHLHEICQLKDSTLFMVGLNGLYRKKDGKIHYYGNDVPVLSRRMAAIKPDGNALWIGSRVDGLMYFNQDTLIRITKEDGLCSNVIRTIYVDREGVCWTGTNEGLSRVIFDRQSLNIRDIKTYTIWDGLPSNKINDIEMQDGSLWIATNKGIASIDPVKLEQKGTVPILTIDSIISGRKFLKTNAELSLKPHQNTLSFYYKAISFKGLSNRDIKYKIKLEGLDREWIRTRNTSIRYTDLAAGDYKFKISAGNVYNNFTQKASSVSFTVEKHYTKTWWFASLIILFSLVAIIAITYFIMNEKSRREENKRKMIQSEQKALRSQMNPHFIFNSLNSIQDFMLQRKEEEVDSYLSDFSTLMRNILEFSKENFIWLSEELKTLEIYLNLEKLRFDNRFIYEFNIEEEIEPSSIKIPPMILQPYLENAIHHGLMHKEGPGHIWLNISRVEPQRLCISIVDDGVGRKLAAEIESRKLKRKPMGMKNIEERVNLMNKVYKTDISLLIEDLYKNNDIPSGTRVNIYFPEFIQLSNQRKRWYQVLKL